MIPYVLALVGSYFIGESMSEKFADGGSVSATDQKKIIEDYEDLVKNYFEDLKEYWSYAHAFEADINNKDDTQELYDLSQMDLNKHLEIIDLMKNGDYKKAFSNYIKLPDDSLYIDSKYRAKEWAEKYSAIRPISLGTAKNEKYGNFYVKRSVITKDAYDLLEKKSFADGGSVSGKEYQIKKPDGTFFYIKMQTGAPAWSTSADMAYQYTKDEAEKIKAMLENQGAIGLSIVKYDKDWWKNTPYDFAKGGVVNPYEQFLLDNGFVKGYERKNQGFVQYRKGKWYCWIDNKTKEIEIGKYENDVPLKDIDGIRENEPFYHTGRYTNSLSKFKKFLDDNYVLDFAKGGVIGDAVRVKSNNKTGVIIKIFKADDFEQFSDIKAEKYYLIKFADGTQDTYAKSEVEISEKFTDGGEVLDKYEVYFFRNKYAYIDVPIYAIRSEGLQAGTFRVRGKGSDEKSALADLKQEYDKFLENYRDYIIKHPYDFEGNFETTIEDINYFFVK